MPDRDEVRYVRVKETDRYIYSVGDNGTLLRTHKDTWRETNAATFVRTKRKKRQMISVTLDGAATRLDKLVAKYFVEGYKDGDEIIHKDGNENNCAADNLIPIDYTDYLISKNRQTHGRPIIVDGVEYPTISSYAKTKFVDPATVLRYMQRGRSFLLGGISITSK